MTYHGIVNNGVVILEGEKPSEGTRVEVTPVNDPPAPTENPATHPAIGLWKDRTDLPDDSVEASKFLRALASFGGRMSNGIFDSSILIDCIRGRPPALAFLTNQSKATTPTTHIMVAAELLAGARDRRDQAAIESFLKTFRVTPAAESDSIDALDLYKQFHLSHGVDWPDCQIAATAVRLNLEVYTLNLKHFSAFPNLRGTRPY